MITDRQRELRRSHIGASDVPAVLGMSPWANRQSVWASKVLDQDEPENDAMALGNLLEPAILQWFEEKTGFKTDRRNAFRVSQGRDGGVLACNKDAGIMGTDDAAVEAKTSSDLEGWGTEGTDEIPDHVILQTQAQCYVCDLTMVWVPVLLFTRPRPELRLYQVHRDDEIIQPMVDQCVDFWQQHVLTKVIPTEESPCLEVLKRLPRQPGKLVEIDAGLVAAWEKAREYRLHAEHAEEGLEALVVQALGDGDGARLSDGRMLTYLESVQKRAAQEAKEVRFRSLKFKKGV